MHILILSFLLFQTPVPAPVCLMVITCPGTPIPTPTPSPSEEVVRIAEWNAKTASEQVVFWNTLLIPEQRVYYWYNLQMSKRADFCIALGFPGTCIPIPVP